MGFKSLGRAMLRAPSVLITVIICHPAEEDDCSSGVIIFQCHAGKNEHVILSCMAKLRHKNK